jgi:signal transduction histidine kinase
MKIFNNTLRNRLIASFFIIGLFSVVISTYIVVRVNTSRLRKEIETAVIEASRKTMDIIKEYQNTAGRISELMLENPAFLNSLQKWPSPSVIQTGNPLILWLPGENKNLSYGKDIIRIEQPEALISGTVKPVENEDGEHAGDLLVGYELGKSFAQDMSLFTNVEISIFYRSDSENMLDEEEKRIEQLLSLGESYYNRNAKFQGKDYEAYYQPLLTGGGEVAGIIFAGIPKSYGFSEIVGEWTFFPILIILAALMAGGLGYTVADFIAKPIMTFTRGVLAVAGGNLNQKINIDSTDELAELSKAFNHMTAKLRELRQIEEELRRKDRLAALGELSAGVAHEIRNPLGIIKSSAQVLAKNPAEKERVKELTGFIIEEVERLNRVITNFLDFARPRAMNKENVSVAAALDKSLRLCENRLKKANISVKKDFSTDNNTVFADGELLRQAFLNLFINAAEAMPGGGTLTISARRRESDKEGKDFMEVIVSDTGFGIPEEVRSKIFNPFFSTKENGSGLGLSIVHKIIESHNGEITLRTSPEKGTAFIISLP